MSPFACSWLKKQRAILVIVLGLAIPAIGRGQVPLPGPDERPLHNRLPRTLLFDKVKDIFG